jgi:hypothetical protein
MIVIDPTWRYFLDVLIASDLRRPEELKKGKLYYKIDINIFFFVYIVYRMLSVLSTRMLQYIRARLCEDLFNYLVNQSINQSKPSNRCSSKLGS